MARYRQPFFDYLRYISEPAHIDAVTEGSRYDLLLEHLGLSSDKLEVEWEWYVKKMAADPSDLLR